MRFGRFELDTDLRRDGEVVKIAPQPLRVLGLLAARPGQIVSRDEIRREIWGDDIHVDFEQGLNSCIKQVRHALGGDAALIETVPKRGYRLRVPRTLPERRTLQLAWYLVHAVAAIALLTFPSRTPPGAGAAPKQLVAVLPFEDITPSSDSFTGGLTEETITQLSRLQPDRLGVITGRDPHVNFVLQGSVRRDAGHVRVSARLISARDQTQVWAATYERETGDDLEIQARVAGRIARSLAGELLPGVAMASTRAATSNSQAFEAYVRGQHALGIRNNSGFREAVEQFSRAVHEDPNYALAYAGLANTYSLMGEYYLLPPSEAFPKARDAALHAIEIDDTLAEAQTSLAFVMAKYEWDRPGAEARFRRAIALNPGYATTHQWYAELLSAMGRQEQALSEIAEARRLDPSSLIIQSVDGYIHYNARRYDEAIALCRGVLARDPHYAPALEFLMLAYARKGMPAETRMTEHALDGLRSVRFLAEGTPPDADTSPYSVAARYAVLGRRDLAFRWLGLACDRHDALVTFAKVDPNLDALRADPRFAGMLRRVGLASN